MGKFSRVVLFTGVFLGSQLAWPPYGVAKD